MTTGPTFTAEEVATLRIALNDYVGVERKRGGRVDVLKMMAGLDRKLRTMIVDASPSRTLTVWDHGEVKRLQGIQKVNPYGSAAHRQAYDDLRAYIFKTDGKDIGTYEGGK